jgi:penicillin-binding protein 1A
LRKLFLFLVSIGLCAAVFLSIFLWWVYRELPNLKSLADYHPAEQSKVFSAEGEQIGAFYTERRTVVSFDRIPSHVVKAFLAAEDAGFYQHQGIDYVGLVRALVKNMRPGAHLQGASTITQQLVKTMVLGAERSLMRKLRELFLSYRLEKILSKDDILYLYMNQIYFGHGAFGIEEASQTYFRKSIDRVDLSEAAFLAAIPKNPSRYNLRSFPSLALTRQRYVLSQMLQHRFISLAEWQKAYHAEIPNSALTEEQPVRLNHLASHYIETVRRLLVHEYGDKLLLEGGLRIETPLNMSRQQAAIIALRQSLEEITKRHGYRGAHFQFDAAESVEIIKAWRLRQPQNKHKTWVWPYDNISDLNLSEGVKARPRWVEAVPYQRLMGVVEGFSQNAQIAHVAIGSVTAHMSFKGMQWARSYQPLEKTPSPKNIKDVLKIGDVIGVMVDKIQGKHIAVTLLPPIVAQSALVAINPKTRYVEALVGGGEFEDGRGFNHATQAKRQAGSVFKPIVYAAALEAHAITPITICPDSPVVITDPWTGKVWKPSNFEDFRFDGNISYRTALMRSKNTCSVRLLQKIGPETVIDLAKKMGIQTHLPRNLTLALGTGSVRVLDLCNAYATIAALGEYQEPIFIRQIKDRTGQVLDLNGIIKNENRSYAMKPETAYVLTNMMQSVMDHGTGWRSLILERPLAGKTGTSQASRDTWFAGFSPELVSAVWMGFDDNSPFGFETGSSSALPAWIRFMGQSLAGVPAKAFEVPKGVVKVWVDEKTGHWAPENAPGAISEVFIQGTEPIQQEQQPFDLYFEDE